MARNGVEDLHEHHALAEGYDHDFIERLDGLLWAVILSRQAERTSRTLEWLRTDNTLTPSTDHDSLGSGLGYEWIGDLGREGPNAHPGPGASGLISAQIWTLGNQWDPPGETDEVASNFYCSAASRSSPSLRTPRSEWSFSDTSNSRSSPDPAAMRNPVTESNPPHILTITSSLVGHKHRIRILCNPQPTKRIGSFGDVDGSNILSDHAASCASQSPRKRQKTSLRHSLSLPLGKISDRYPFARAPASLRRALSLRSDFSSSIVHNRVRTLCFRDWEHPPPHPTKRTAPE
jgi:hypothetical protein